MPKTLAEVFEAEARGEDPTAPKNVNLLIRVSAADRARYKAACSAAGLSVSEAVRAHLDELASAHERRG